MTSSENSFERLEETIREGAWLKKAPDVPVSEENLAYVRDFLQALKDSEIDESPSIFLLEDGGISLEWTSTQAYLAVVISGNSVSSFSVNFKLEASTSLEITSFEQILESVRFWKTDRLVG